MKLRLSKAFTMIEMMVVLLIIGFIAAIVVPNVAKYMRAAKEAKIKLQMSTIKSALMSYYADFGTYPRSREEGGLRALVENPRPNDEEYRKAEREGKWPYITGGEKGLMAVGDEEFTYNNPPTILKEKKGYHYYELIWIGRGTEDEPEFEMGE